jgi:acyl carrier protein
MDALLMRSQSTADDRTQAVIEVVAKALEVSPDDLGAEASMDNTPLWDSVAHLTICLEFERRFGRALDLEKIFTASSVRDLAELVP